MSDSTMYLSLDPSAKVTEIPRVFGLIKEIHRESPDGKIHSSEYQYAGPPKKFFLWIALVLGPNNWLQINGKWVRWDIFSGFYGNGLQELLNLRKSA